MNPLPHQSLDEDLFNPVNMSAAINAALMSGQDDRYNREERARYIDLMDTLCIGGIVSADPDVVRQAGIASVLSVMLRGPENSALSLLRPLPVETARSRILKAIQVHNKQVELPEVVMDVAHRVLSRLPKTIAQKLSVTVVTTKSALNASSEFKQYQRLREPIALNPAPDASALEQMLNKEFPWATTATSSIVNELRLAKYCGRDYFKMRPTLLVGDPGTGKSRFCRRLGEIVGVPFRVVCLAGASDGLSLRGTPAGWSSARPSAVAQFLRQHLVANPIIVVEEIDKVDPQERRNGNPLDVLLAMTEVENARTWFDEAIEVSVDLSFANFVATSNTLAKLPKPLLDRFQIIHFPAPRKEHYPELINSVMRSIATEYNIADSRLLPEIDQGERDRLVEGCGNVRQLAHAIRRLIQCKVSEPSAGRHGLVH